jgi:hypothetical protein
VGPEANHCLGGADTELHLNHALGLVELDAMSESTLGDGAHPLRTRAILLVQQDHQGYLCARQRLVEGLAGQRAHLVAVDVQSPQARRADLQREGEHRLDALFACGRHVRGPARQGILGEVGNEHRPAGRVGVDAGSLTEGELQLLDDLARGIRGGSHALGPRIGDQADPGS